MPHPAGAALAFAAALLCAAACQRFPTGGIEGTVRDHSGALIANVHVGVLGLALSGPSDASGRYRLARVPVGTHRLRATAVGYVPLERDSVVVRKGVTTRVDFTLDRMWPGLGLPSTPVPHRATNLAALKRSESRRVSACAAERTATTPVRLPRARGTRLRTELKSATACRSVASSARTRASYRPTTRTLWARPDAPTPRTASPSSGRATGSRTESPETAVHRGGLALNSVEFLGEATIIRPMRVFRLLNTHRFLAALLLLCLGVYGVESEVADVHHGGAEAASGEPAHGSESTAHLLQAPSGTNPDNDNRPAHVCHCSHTHVGVLATAPSLLSVVIPAPRREWRAPAVLPSVRPIPPLRPPIA